MLIYPIAFYLGARPIYSYGLFALLGTLVLFGMGSLLARRAGQVREQALPVLFGVLVGAFVVARLTQMLAEPARIDELINFYGLLQPRTPGNILGIMLGGFLGGVGVQRLLGLPSFANQYAPPLAAASVCWRCGCTCAGCCYGTPTSLPWAVHLDGANCHPTMIYEGLFNLLMFALLWRLRRRAWRDGELLYLYFGCYAVFRFSLEYIRTYPVVAFGLTGIQYMCLTIITWLGGYLLRRALRPAAPIAGASQ